MKSVKMTQRKLAGGYIRGWLQHENDDAGFIRVMSQLLEESESHKCEGGHSDGSINDEQWDLLRDLCRAIASQRLHLGGALNALGLDEEGNTHK